MIKKAIFKQGFVLAITLILGSTLVACQDDKKNTSVCDQVFNKAAVYVDSLPEAQKQAFNAQIETLKQQIEKNKTQAQELCQTALEQLNHSSK